ncbi:uncharacterized protein LOC132311127 [Cornus florida]|uniref:uncharacterized protein LOC132311127 n=1 Tax=Cornus florida TaxID=4283 RepID=UPI0028A25F8A|nr:uncharacterized protein LOC132311127 [Cornus florida]XP_059664851.1 uncharacterized protein LOC132311127 [Cornus florida]XP_059664852.1 uncharacterized protein LOC132311127 [Cornus florida]XP_059664853.1 uncharacterized protein LOC132311127 [Cornus florida]XP_059664854.1 uncharacterized protein LOC132311127 [Cornus florida]
MRRQGHYGDSGGNAYVAARMQHVSSGQRMEHRSGGYYQGRPEPLTSEKEHPYGISKAEGQLRWERDGSKIPNPMSSHMFNEGQGGDASRSYYQGQRPDPKMGSEKQGNNDRRSQPHEEDMDVGYDDNVLLQTFDGLEQKFLDDIMKLTKDQTDAEDAENARHRERINTINAQYQEQLAALRARHTSRRDEFLRRESHERQQQYQQAAMDHYPNSGMGPSESHGYGLAATPTGELQRSYSDDHYDSYRERARFLGSTRDQEIESRGPYPGGRVYDTSSRYY